MKRKIFSALLACALLVSACSAKTEIPMEREPQESHVKEEAQMPQSKGGSAPGEEVTIPEPKKSPAAPTQARIEVQPTAFTPPVAAPRQTGEAGKQPKPSGSQTAKKAVIPAKQTPRPSISTEIPATATQTVKAQATPTPTRPPTPQPTPTPEPSGSAAKTAYDYPFDIGRIKADMIARGKARGYKHQTKYEDGRAITPDNSSWEIPVAASEKFQGTHLKNALMEYVDMFETIGSHGGEMEYFTVYAQETSGGYTIYILH